MHMTQIKSSRPFGQLLLKRNNSQPTTLPLCRFHYPPDCTTSLLRSRTRNDTAIDGPLYIGNGGDVLEETWKSNYDRFAC